MRRLVVVVVLLIMLPALIGTGCGAILKASKLNPAAQPAAAAASTPYPSGSPRASIGTSDVGREEHPRGSGGAHPVAATLPQPSVTHTTLMTVYRNVQYGVINGHRLLLDAYVPISGTHSAVVVIHGGGWAHGDKAALAFEGENLAAAGYGAFVIDYRMAPPGGDFHAPIPLDDARTAVIWVRAHAATYHVSSTKVGVLGNSAGGNLAMMLGTTGTVDGTRAQAVVSYSGQSELLKLSTPHTIHAADNYIGCVAKVCPSKWIANSPIDHVDKTTAPMFLVNSSHELMPLDQATDMAKKLKEIGVPYELRILSGGKHASACANEVWPQTLSFLHQYLGQ